MCGNEDLTRLTAFEEYMFLDDTPAFPMYSYQTLRLSGEIDRSALEDAYRAAMARHPLLNASVETRGKRFYWRFLSEPPAMIDRVRLATDPARAVDNDINTEAGTRIFFDRLIDGEGRTVGTELGFQVHHSSADAMGIFAFMRDLLLGYARRVGTADSSLPPVSEHSLLVRNDYGLTAEKYVKRFLQNARSTGALVFHLPEPLFPVPAPEKERPSGPYPCERPFELTLEQTDRYRRTARRLGLTVNDLLLRDLFLATAESMDAETERSNGWIRIAMPINMRRDIHENMFAANMVSMVFLDRRRQAIADTDLFAREIHRSTELIKRYEMGMVLLRNLQGRRVLPGGIQMELAANRCWATTVLSNLGRILDSLELPRDDEGKILLGDARIESYSGSPPLRYKTLASWGTWSYAGKISLAVRWDERYLTEAQRELLFETYRRRVLKTLS